MTKPLAIDLFCGLGGWSDGLLEEGYRVVGFDIEIRPYPAQLVIQDVLTLHGSQFRDAAVIVASPPCQNYSYLAMPWSRSTNPDNSKAAKALRKKWETEGPDNRLFDACFRIQREAIEATRKPCPACLRHPGKLWTARWEMCQTCKGAATVTRYIPLIVENVRGAIPWVGRSAWNYGSFHLWGDVPALMPINMRGGVKLGGGRSWTGKNGYGSADYKSFGFNTENEKVFAGTWREGVKVPSEDGGRRTDIGKGVRFTSRDCGIEGTKIGGDWFSDPKSTCRKHGSRSAARKLASAQIAKIPLPLAQHIAHVYYPRSLAKGGRPPDAAGNPELSAGL